MAPLTRRELLRAAAAMAALPALAACDDGSSDGDASVPATFPQGVASGDPLSDAVILWTRAVPEDAAQTRVPLQWVVARDAALRDIVASGSAMAPAEQDYTLKLDVQGLAPGTTYYYAFLAAATRSPVGRTRTAPIGATERLRLAVVTCGDYTRGLFHAYARIAERADLDAVIHLGDYIYETDRQDRVRPHLPPVKLTQLDHYRGRYASYRLDPDLQELHRQHPVIWVWDDHETCDGTWMDGADPNDHIEAEDGPFSARKAAALQAALEWLPIRMPDPANPERIYRGFEFGDLVDLAMIDTRRIGREEPLEPNGVFGPLGLPAFTQTGGFADPARQILGAEQEAWLIQRLQASTARWKLLGNQVVFSQLKLLGLPEATGLSLFVNPDQWDGYAAARERLFDAIDGQVSNLVVLTGDVHAAFAMDVSRDPNNPLVYNPLTGSGAVAVEFVTPSISSAGDPSAPDGADELLEQLVLGSPELVRTINPHIKLLDSRNGYLLLDVTRERLQGEFWFVPFVEQATDEQVFGGAFATLDGESRLRAVDVPSAEREDASPLAD